MNPRRLLAVSRKELIHVVRDPRSLGMGIAIPLLLLVLFGYALSLDVDNVPLLVWDQSQTPQSREIVSRFTGSRYFSVKGQPSSYRDIERAIDRRDALMGLVIPSGFGGPAAGRPTSLQLLVDGSDASTAAIAIGYAEGVVRAYGLDTSLEALRRAGARVAERPLDVRPRVLFNEDLESRNYIIPGLIAVIMMVIAALLTSLTVAKEWESGTMEQLVSTPLKGSELILGKLLPYVGIGMLDVLLSVLMGAFVFHVPLRGSVLLLFGMAAIFLVGALSLGMLISIVTKSQLLASQLAMVATFLPAFLLSGFMYDIDNMPRTLRLITLAVPARYFVALLKGIYLKGVGLDVLTFEAGLLVVFAAAMLGLANVKFQKKLV